MMAMPREHKSLKIETENARREKVLKEKKREISK